MCKADACPTSQFVSTSYCLRVNALSLVCRAGVTHITACTHVTQQEVFNTEAVALDVKTRPASHGRARDVLLLIADLQAVTEDAAHTVDAAEVRQPKLQKLVGCAAW